jgi:hypothetical protein
MTDGDQNEDPRSRIHDAIDPLLPRPGVEQRVLRSARRRIEDGSAPQRLWWQPLRTTLGGTLMALLVVAVVGGTLGITLGLRGHSPSPAKTPLVRTPVPFPTKPPTPPPATATPAETPSTIRYVQPSSLSFPTAVDGWVLGSACDQQQKCRPTLARTSNGGGSWSLVHLPLSFDTTAFTSGLVAGSKTDVWIWGSLASGDAVLATTHNGGQTWQQTSLGSADVVDIQIANGTAWVEVACGDSAPPCAHLLSQPVHGGRWTNLGPLPSVVQGPAYRNGAVPGPQLIRSGSNAWIWNDNQQRPALVRTNNGGRTWQTLPMPCTFGNTVVLGASSASHIMLECAQVGGGPPPQEVWSSTDGGSRWTLRSRSGYNDYTPPRANVGNTGDSMGASGLVVINDTTSFLANAEGDALVTHDDGVTWFPTAIPASQYFGGGGAVDLAFSGALHGWAFAPAGVWNTTDGGVHWHLQPIIGSVPGY